jgi:hypothetical protein
VRQATLRADHPYVGFAEARLAHALCEAGDPTAAREHADTARRLLGDRLSNTSEEDLLRAVRARCG